MQQACVVAGRVTDVSVSDIVLQRTQTTEQWPATDTSEYIHLQHTTKWQLSAPLLLKSIGNTSGNSNKSSNLVLDVNVNVNLYTASSQWYGMVWYGMPRRDVSVGFIVPNDTL